MNTDPKTKTFQLEDIATTWNNDTLITAYIPVDDFIHRGNDLVVSLLIEANDKSLQEADKTSKDSANIIGFEKDGYKTSDTVIIAVIVSVVVIILALTLIVSVCICYKV
jgi:hypothetical protein